SDYPFRTLEGAPRIEGAGVNTHYSLGKGGFSAVWGTSIMPYAQRDIASWPVTAEELAPHYRAVLEFMPAAQGHDALEEKFPTFRVTEPMPLSPQAATLLGKLDENAAELRARHVMFGRSRLAVDSKHCVRCGLCMYGCPYGLLYNTAQTVDALAANPNFRYAPGYVVQRVEESAGEVRVHALRAADGVAEVFLGERAFVAAGTLATTALMLRSLSLYDTEVSFADSQYFLLPMLRMGSVPGFETSGLQTLAQLFLEMTDPKISAHTVHMQLYTYNDLFQRLIDGKLGPLVGMFPSKAFFSRLFLLQGYLHSDDSRKIVGKLRRTAAGDVFELHAPAREDTKRTLRRLTRKLGSLRGLTGLHPMGLMLKAADPGRGFHTGGSFPMAHRPEGLQSDLLGRTGGLERIHIVDSSTMPSIAATTVTFTAMANAHRIGWSVGQ
ncbi:MAG: GMC oxidoreductase, partial [Bryocella sp.]